MEYHLGLQGYQVLMKLGHNYLDYGMISQVFRTNLFKANEAYLNYKGFKVLARRMMSV